MAELLKLPTFGDDRGFLTVVDGTLPFAIKRVYFIYDTKEDRGAHRHHETWHAAVAVKGRCQIDVDDGKVQESHVLDKPDQCLIMRPEEWRELLDFSSDAVLVVMSSTSFDPDDYIYEPYR